MNKLSIEIVSDFVCPWCYVGKRRLERALGQRPEVEVQLTWLPYQLSPDMPLEGVDRAQHYAEIFGAKRAQQIMTNMQQTGREEGIHFNYKDGAVSPNTLSAHVLLDRVQSRSANDANKLAEALFKAHHVDCKNIGDERVLLEILEICGIRGLDAEDSLLDLSKQQRIQSSIEQSLARGVTGVPFFVVNQEYGISGAQPTEQFVKFFDQILLSANE